MPQRVPRTPLFPGGCFWAAANTALRLWRSLVARGGIVDRVVELGSGDDNVRYIGVNWPHHVFLNQDFNVIGAE